MTGDWATLKARQRATAKGRVYDRARNRALTRLAQRYPDDYQKFLEAEKKKVQKELRQESKKAG